MLVFGGVNNPESSEVLKTDSPVELEPPNKKPDLKVTNFTAKKRRDSQGNLMDVSKISNPK